MFSLLSGNRSFTLETIQCCPLAAFTSDVNFDLNIKFRRCKSNWLTDIISITCSCRKKLSSLFSSRVDRYLLTQAVFSISHPSLDTMFVGLVLVQVLLMVRPAAGYNLDQEHSLVFAGPPSSMFGYSVLLHHYSTHNWSVRILVSNLYSPSPLLLYFCTWCCPRGWVYSQMWFFCVSPSVAMWT